MDSRSRVHLSSVNTELQDVQRIMVQNIDDVLQRGVAISGKLVESFFYEATFPFDYLLIC